MAKYLVEYLDPDAPELRKYLDPDDIQTISADESRVCLVQMKNGDEYSVVGTPQEVAAKTGITIIAPSLNESEQLAFQRLIEGTPQS